MLSGIFDDDQHERSEPQYGFDLLPVDDIGEQVLVLDHHIQTFTSRNLSYEGDSLNAFLGVAARYSTNAGLMLILGLPSKLHRMGKKHGFVATLSVLPDGKGMREDDELETRSIDPAHNDYFRVLTSVERMSRIDKSWSAEIVLQDEEGMNELSMYGWAQVRLAGADLQKSCLLTIRKPLVLEHFSLTYALVDGERICLTEEVVSVHLSVKMSERELVTGHESGDSLSVLVFSGTVPFVWNGIARFLVFRRVEDGHRWERVGRMNLWITEKMMKSYSFQSS
ncbi:hypothetical protein K504DRAFT_498488 [Pleomassaria siparia CBS 279.74]|uniref:Heterokaryon incompatibility domain-containing protein n=1 Tax=Pleomassaria siparia CBS 279.74 TaxID=1314801 RepID=A0A6G1KLB7_9PLEO|nr:hypothetical protein K504DRAFT_498488 [Pleomassaria siparia CBS 279.74]